MDMARRAGTLLLNRFEQGPTVEFKSKGQGDPVTAADRESEELLYQAIKAAYPEHAVVGEEGADHPGTTEANVAWVLDPLDGTANFAGGLPLFAVSIGVLHRFRPVACALFTTVSHSGRPGVFHAHAGGGAFFDEKPLASPDSLEEVRVRLSGTLQRQFYRAWPTLQKRNIRLDVRSLGSIALEMALVAAGSMKSAAFSSPRIWDVAAGALLVKEASGLVLTRESHRSKWRPLDSFDVKEQAQPLEGLRTWSAPVLIGHREIIEVLTAAASPPKFGILSLPGFLRRLLRS